MNFIVKLCYFIIPNLISNQASRKMKYSFSIQLKPKAIIAGITKNPAARMLFFHQMRTWFHVQLDQIIFDGLYSISTLIKFGPFLTNLEAIHMLRKHIFGLFAPPTLYISIFLVLKISIFLPFFPSLNSHQIDYGYLIFSH